jgi:hypothetical protein
MHLRQNLTPTLDKPWHAIRMSKVVAVDLSKPTWRVKEVGVRRLLGGGGSWLFHNMGGHFAELFKRVNPW